MKYYGIASPRIVMNTLPSFLMFVFLEMGVVIGFRDGYWIVWMMPIVFLIIFIVEIIIHRNALCFFAVDKNGIRNHTKSISWENIKNVELVYTEMWSRVVRGRKIHQFSICIGEVVSGNLFDQSPNKSIFLPLSHKSVAQLRKFGGGNSIVLEKFLDSCIDIDD